MLFLFNDVLLDLGDARDRLIASGCPLGYTDLIRMTPPKVMSVVRDTIFKFPQFPRERPDKALALVALVQIKTGANAMLCVRPPQATQPVELPVRLAEVALPVLGQLATLRKEGTLTPAAIDQVVWMAA
jgi:hypothetical protein